MSKGSGAAFAAPLAWPQSTCPNESRRRFMARKSVLTSEWPAVREQVQTGDLVLYAGGKGAFCATIKRLTKSRWAHVGLVICDHPAEQPLLWESVADEDRADLETGQIRSGERLILLKE